MLSYLLTFLVCVSTSLGLNVLQCNPNCHADERIGCSLVYVAKECHPSELHERDVGGLWPGQPQYVRITKYSSATADKSSQDFNITWASPNDGSAQYVKGFELELQPVNDHLIGFKACYVFNISHDGSTVHILPSVMFTLSCNLTLSMGEIELFTRLYTLPKQPSGGKFAHDLTDFRVRRHSPKMSPCDSDPEIHAVFNPKDQILVVSLGNILPNSTYDVHLMRGSFSFKHQVIGPNDDQTIFGDDKVLTVGVCYKIWVSLKQCADRWTRDNVCVTATQKPELAVPGPSTSTTEKSIGSSDSLSPTMTAIFVVIVIMIIVLGVVFALCIVCRHGRREKFRKPARKMIHKLAVCCKPPHRAPSQRSMLNNHPDMEMRGMNRDVYRGLPRHIPETGEPLPCISVIHVSPHEMMVPCIKAFLGLLTMAVEGVYTVKDYIDEEMVNRNPERWFQDVINDGIKGHFLVVYSEGFKLLIEADGRDEYYPDYDDTREGGFHKEFMPKFRTEALMTKGKKPHTVTFGYEDMEHLPSTSMNPSGMVYKLSKVEEGRRCFNLEQFNLLLKSLKVKPLSEENKHRFHDAISEFIQAVTVMGNIMSQDENWFFTTNGQAERQDTDRSSTTSLTSCSVSEIPGSSECITEAPASNGTSGYTTAPLDIIYYFPSSSSP